MVASCDNFEIDFKMIILKGRSIFFQNIRNMLSGKSKNSSKFVSNSEKYL